MSTFETLTHDSCNIWYNVSILSFHSKRSLLETAKHTNDDVTKLTITRDFYVEDLLSGSNSLEDSCYLQDSLIAVLHESGFPLLKWTSNEPKLVSRLPENLRGESGGRILLKDPFYNIKTLGVQWIPISDTMTFQIAEILCEVFLEVRCLLLQLESLILLVGYHL